MVGYSRVGMMSEISLNGVGRRGRSQVSVLMSAKRVSQVSVLMSAKRVMLKDNSSMVDIGFCIRCFGLEASVQS